MSYKYKTQFNPAEFLQEDNMVREINNLLSEVIQALADGKDVSLDIIQKRICELNIPNDCMTHAMHLIILNRHREGNL